MAKQFEADEVYEHTGKTYYIVRRTAKTIWLASGSKDGVTYQKRIKLDSNGNEWLTIDEFRSLHAKQFRL